MTIGSVVPAHGFTVSINVEIPDDFLSVEDFKAALPFALLEVGERAKDFWVSEAGRRLRSTRLQYQEAIQLDSDEEGFTLALAHPDSSVQALLMAVEMGAPGFDMKPGFMRNRPNTNVPLNEGHIPNFSPAAATTFRKLSAASNPSGWIHPGWSGVFLHTNVIQEIEENIIPEVIQNLINELF